MKITPETTEDIVSIITHEFKTFGGGKVSDWNNPISRAMADSKASFAMGVSVEDVINRVIELNEMIHEKA